MTALDWRHSYHQTQRATAAALKAARAEGRVRYVFGDGGPSTLGTCDPSRLTDRQVADLAARHAENVVQRAMNQEIERRRRLGLPLDGMVDEV